MNTYGVTHLRKSIRQRADGRDLTRLDTGMQERRHTGPPPTFGDSLKILFEGSKDDVAVAVD